MLAVRIELNLRECMRIQNLHVLNALFSIDSNSYNRVWAACGELCLLVRSFLSHLFICIEDDRRNKPSFCTDSHTYVNIMVSDKEMKQTMKSVLPVSLPKKRDRTFIAISHN